MNRAVTILVLFSVFFVTNAAAQIELAPIGMLAGQWVTISFIAVLIFLLLWCYALLTRSMRENVPKVKRIVFAAAIYLVYIGFLFASRGIALETVTVGRTIEGLEQRRQLERKVGFKIVVQDISPSQKILFLRGNNRKEKLLSALEKRGLSN